MNEETLFHNAQAKPAAERAAFLDASCGSDVALRRRIQSLLDAHDNPGSFMAKPILDLAVTLDQEQSNDRPPFHGYIYSGGSAGGTGGAGSGGGIYAAATTLTLRNVTATANSATGGAGGTGGLAQPAGATGIGAGGGLYLAAIKSPGLDAFTISDIVGNTASTRYNDIFGSYVRIV